MNRRRLLRLRFIENWFDERSSSEKVIFIVTLSLMIFFVADKLFLADMDEKSTQLRLEVERVQANNEAVAAQLEAIMSRVRRAKAQREQETSALREELNKLSEKKALLLSRISDPDNIVKKLSRLLKTHNDVRLASVKNSPAKLIQVGTEEENSVIYKHVLSFRVEGPYHSLKAYLKDLEKGEKSVFWDFFEMDSTDQESRIRIDAYTLSVDKVWFD